MSRPLESRAVSAEGPGPDLCSGRNRDESGGEDHLTHGQGLARAQPQAEVHEGPGALGASLPGMVPSVSVLIHSFLQQCLSFSPPKTSFPSTHIPPFSELLLPCKPAGSCILALLGLLFPSLSTCPCKGSGSPQTPELFSGTQGQEKEGRAFKDGSVGRGRWGTCGVLWGLVLSL